MPWITKEDRGKVDTNFKTIKELTVGEGTYLFYKRFLTIWLKESRYKTIHFIGLLRDRPEQDKETWELRNQMLFKNLKASDIIQCIKDAHHQMERVYFDPYEQKKLEENGEVEL